MNEEKLRQEFIEKKRGEILLELEAYLKEMGNPMTIEYVLAQVLEDSGDDAFDDLIVMLSESDDVPDPETAQEFAMELFNYFPRKSLGGKSFAETISFEKLKKMDEDFQKFKDGVPSGE